ncbi:hypothetical protein [Vibrio phage 29Fa.3]|nr:hypothetical protein [Vibrio phage 29Fa.3]
MRFPRLQKRKSPYTRECRGFKCLSMTPEQRS